MLLLGASGASFAASFTVRVVASPTVLVWQYAYDLNGTSAKVALIGAGTLWVRFNSLLLSSYIEANHLTHYEYRTRLRRAWVPVSAYTSIISCYKLELLKPFDNNPSTKVKSLHSTLQATLQSTTDHALGLELYARDLGEVLKTQKNALGELRRGVLERILLNASGSGMRAKETERAGTSAKEAAGEEERKESSISISWDPPAYVESDSVSRSLETSISPSTSLSLTRTETLAGTTSPSTSSPIDLSLVPRNAPPDDFPSNTDLTSGFNLDFALYLGLDSDTASIETQATLPAYSAESQAVLSPGRSSSSEIGSF